MTLTVGSLFSGIGGLDLGLERAGMEVIWQSEIDPYACKVLSKHWPQVPNHGNIKDINWGDIVRPDIICGGYPCQPFSTAGNRNGADDPRHLWPWVREAISRIRPKYAILENVRGHITLGLDTVLADLASIGYDAEWTIVSASSVGAPHQRDRVIIIAYSIGQLADTNSERHIYGRSQVITADRWIDALGHIASSGADVAHANIRRQQELHDQALQQQQRRTTTQCLVPEQSGTHWWTVEPHVGRVANGIPKRMDRLRGLGNAVVPQVAELVGRMVMEHHNQ